MLKLSVTDKNISDIKSDIVAIGIFKGGKIPPVFKDKIEKAIKAKRFKGKEKECLLFDAPDKFFAEKIIVIGLGKESDFDTDKARLAAAIAVRKTKGEKLSSLAMTLIDYKNDDDVFYAQLEGAFLAGYSFKKLTKKDKSNKELNVFSIAVKSSKKMSQYKKHIKKAEIIQNAINKTKNLVNLPANIVTPSYLEKEAKQIAVNNSKVKMKVISFAEAKKLGMGGFCAVGQGTNEAPKFIVLEYKNSGKETVGLVGKGITFDSGGISIKPSKGMGEMKTDMGGAATVLGAFKALSDLGIKKNIIAVMPATENMPSGKAYKPGDVIKMYSGLNVEINSTDAEGRMVLADALHYVQKKGAKKVINYATLTGACLVGLGQTRTGLMTNDEGFAKEYLGASEVTGEKHWQLPMDDEYDELLKSDVADTLNNSNSRYAGTITAGKFLQKFIEKGTKWIHCDIAGTAYISKPQRYIDKNATGVAIRTLVELFSSP